MTEEFEGLSDERLKQMGYERGCKECFSAYHEGFYPSHNGSKNCQSGSPASGGTNAHCTCDSCF